MHYKSLLTKVNIQSQLYKGVTFIREAAYPRRCPICTDIVMPKGSKVCKKCRGIPVYVTEPYCMKCGKPILAEEKEYCYDCTFTRFHFISGRALFVYDKIMRESIAGFKFHGKKEYADYYAEEMLRVLGGYIKSVSPELLLPVPIHKNRRIKRGFNQAEILADKLSKSLGIKTMHGLLIRQKNTAPQKELSGKERLKNLEKAFCVNEDVYKKISGITKVMIIDDIYTTGSTIEVCSRILLSYGIKEVYFISLCIGKGY